LVHFLFYWLKTSYLCGGRLWQIIFVSIAIEMSPWFHPMLESKLVTNRLNEGDCCLAIFEMTIKTNELAKELMNREFKMFWSYQVDTKDIKCFWSGGKNMSPCFHLLLSLLVRSLRLWDLKSKLKRFFLLVGYWKIWIDVISR
jgi:hypothetical protein